MRKELDEIIEKHAQLKAMQLSVVKFAQELEKEEHEFFKSQMGLKDGEHANVFDLIKKALGSSVVL